MRLVALVTHRIIRTCGGKRKTMPRPKVSQQRDHRRDEREQLDDEQREQRQDMTELPQHVLQCALRGAMRTLHLDTPWPGNQHDSPA